MEWVSMEQGLALMVLAFAFHFELFDCRLICSGLVFYLGWSQWEVCCLLLFLIWIYYCSVFWFKAFQVY